MLQTFRIVARLPCSWLLCTDMRVLRYIADASCVTWDERTSLEGDVEHRRVQIITILLNFGVKPYGSLRSQFDRAMSWPQQRGLPAVVSLLKSQDSLQNEECES